MNWPPSILPAPSCSCSSGRDGTRWMPSLFGKPHEAKPGS